MDIKVDEKTVVVFDLDDTLYNEIDYLKSAYMYIAKIVEPVNWKFLYAKMFSMYRSGENVFEILSSRYDRNIDDLLSYYRFHKPKINLNKGVLEVLNKIKLKKGKLGIITDGRVKTQLAKIEALEIKDFFDEIIISEAIGSEKPSIQNFKILENSLPAKQYIYIADNLKKDFISPNKLRWLTIGMIDSGLNIHSTNWKYHKDGYLPKDFIFSFEELNIV
ncbi:MAG: HAD family hydrolase [Flavobacteriaceae bacterium]|uniref:HAD family hydrolase n=1 Tax=Winogradskyella sp. SYSU M77433 TaxID=3042722 RepID=UPI000C553ECF|nr:HAD family hydrolase [Winogradskyella sp. SYSU M77433]MAX72036.1 HAD family hydrolase [Flavobacteriaceae bacterium]MDH7913963.1 HAD family hydrolase [Winogradskyella sp. SYSU M77433]|tara:strand:+ start:2098 stop:2754 length:657 start_codon:yes stop_codon:yes gene_type:complete